MSATTPIAGLRYAVQTDGPVAQTLAQNLATDLDNKLIPVYATTAARDTAIPSPTQGMFCYVTSVSAGGRTLMGYTGTAWVPYFSSPLYAVKAANESVTSSITFQNDDHLVLAVEANTNYTLTGFLLANGDIDGDLKLQFTYPVSAAITYGLVAPALPNTGNSNTDANLGGRPEDASSPSNTVEIGTTTSSTNPTTVIFMGYLSVGATAGNLVLQWAQQTSSATATTLLKNSWIKLERVT